MSTPLQRASSRRNSQLSTGPRTPRGRAAVTANPLTHGFYSRVVLSDFEDPADYHATLADYLADLRPAGAVETELVHRYVKDLWKLRRLERLERAFLVDSIEQAERRLDSPIAASAPSSPAALRCTPSSASTNAKPPSSAWPCSSTASAAPPTPPSASSHPPGRAPRRSRRRLPALGRSLHPAARVPRLPRRRTPRRVRHHRRRVLSRSRSYAPDLPTPPPRPPWSPPAPRPIRQITVDASQCRRIAVADAPPAPAALADAGRRPRPASPAEPPNAPESPEIPPASSSIHKPNSTIGFVPPKTESTPPPLPAQRTPKRPSPPAA